MAMICPALFNQDSSSYPIGNSPAVSLTQDLPPEQDADILLLGCGDARNILFTCYADTARKIDVTCCDIEPLVHARNVLLYSLLIEDTANLNIERIWNIYYHWKIDTESLKLLETQAEKLLQVSATIEQWHDSAFGSMIRFCDAKSLSCVRSYWSGFTTQGLSSSEKKGRLKQLQTAIDIPQAWKMEGLPKGDGVTFVGLQSAYPAGFEAGGVVDIVSRYWWTYGTLPSNKPCGQETTHLNPALLYSQNPAVKLTCMLHPLLGIPICTAFTPIIKKSALHIEYKDKSSPKYVVECAKNLFKLWASAFRRAVANKLVIRIFCGDALDFSFTLRNCQLKSTSMPCNGWSVSPVQLYPGDYSSNENAAPVSFDVVDTSNLAETLGPLNLIPITSSLLKYHASSCLYTEILLLQDHSLIDRLNSFFGVDVRTMSLLLGLVAPHTFTNGTDSFEEDPVTLVLIGKCDRQTFARSRLRWRRLKGSRESGNFPYIHVDGEKLALFLCQVYCAMFKHEDLDHVVSLTSAPTPGSIGRILTTYYNRASFASLLSFLKTTVISDWDLCLDNLCNKLLHSMFCPISVTVGHQEDLLLCLHNYGVYSRQFKKPTHADVRNSALASVLPCMDDLPEQLCVTVRVPRKQLSIFTRKAAWEMGNTAVELGFHSQTYCWYFSVVKLTFGTWRKETKENPYPFIEEDSSQQLGTSDMFLSAMVSTKVLLEPKQKPPWVHCELLLTLRTLQIFKGDFGNDLCFARYIMTSENVYITRFMPGMSALPSVMLANTRQGNPMLTEITVELEDDGSKIKSLIQCVSVEPKAKSELACKSATVEVKFISPFAAVMFIGQSEKLEFKFPVPVSPTDYKIRFEKNLSCVKIESPLFDPLGKDAACFLFPMFLMETPGAIVPTPWTSTRIDLDAMPPIDLTDKPTASWIVTHAGLMFSNRELRNRLSNISAVDTNDIAKIDIRTDLKDGLFSILMHYTGLIYQQADFFALIKKNVIQTFIVPSCLRLDLANHTVVLDAAVIPLTKTVLSDPRAAKFIKEFTKHDLCQVRVSEVENRAWKAMMPALVERCRTAATWKHAPDCEYVQAGEVPLSKGLSEDGVSSICSCGVGKFPAGNYLQNQIKKLPNLSYMISQYATRAAIGLIFAVPYVEDCALEDFSEQMKNLKLQSTHEVAGLLRVYGVCRSRYNEGKCILKEKCVTCGRFKKAGGKSNKHQLLVCSKCRLIKYCSVECQKIDWKKHKHLCVATRKITVPSEDGSPKIQYVSY